jgi:predicted membrane protein
MQGRYGVDSLSKFLLVIAIIFILLDNFLFTKFFYLAGVILMLVVYFRMFSRHYPKRSAENQWFLKHTYKIRKFFKGNFSEMNMRKTHHIYKCPGCRQKIRIPRGRGKIEITCPKCYTRFIKKS